MSPIDFHRFTDQLQQRLKLPLPGSLAHEPMRAVPIGAFKPDFTHKLPPKPGSVLILLYPDKDTIKLPLTLRAEYVGTHSGQISLPGGKREKGEDEIVNALRECEEEIGVPRDQVNVIGRLTDFFVIPSNFMVTPIVGYCESKPTFIQDPVEVAGILEYDIKDLVKDDAIITSEILAAKLYPMMAPHFLVEERIVWGATAMMLSELRMILRESQMVNW